MRCPYCHREDTQVTDSRLSADGQAVKRRRRCKHCGKRFTTYERVERIGLTVVKRDHTREEAVNEIEAELFRQGTAEVPSTLIGELVMQKLRELDEVAYIRFASVYRNFADLEEMREAMEGLAEGPPGAGDAGGPFEPGDGGPVQD